MTTFIRRVVSQNRFRYEEGGYNLDLSYICDNIIAMGLPAQKFIDAMARNPLDVVQRYLKENHNNAYKIYNLLDKPKYDHSSFDNMVESYPMKDHYPPNFKLIEQFCTSVHEWLTKKSDNVAVVHCKAGKGRTGTMIACYFLFSKKTDNPFEAMELFGRSRCVDGRGITIPSQRRYVEYYADYIQNKRIYDDYNLYLKQIEIHMPSNRYFNVLSFQVIKNLTTKLYDSNETQLSLKRPDIILKSTFPIRLNGDIQFEFYNKSFGNKTGIFHVTFNTFCLLQNNQYSSDERSCQGKLNISEDCVVWTLNKNQIDGACKDKRFSDDFKIVFYFDRTENAAKSTIKNDNEIIESNFYIDNKAFDNLQSSDDNELDYPKLNGSKNGQNDNTNLRPYSGGAVIFEVKTDDENASAVNLNNKKLGNDLFLFEKRKIFQEKTKILKTNANSTKFLSQQASELSEQNDDINLASRSDSDIHHNDDYAHYNSNKMEKNQEIKANANKENEKNLKNKKKSRLFSIKKLKKIILNGSNGASNSDSSKYQRCNQDVTFNNHNEIETLGDETVVSDGGEEEITRNYMLLGSKINSNNKTKMNNVIADNLLGKNNNNNDHANILKHPIKINTADNDDDEYEDDNFKVEKSGFKKIISKIKSK